MPAPKRDWGDPRALTDEELLALHRKQPSDACFGELVLRYSGELQRHLIRLTGDTFLADDLLQNTWFQVHSRRELYQEGRPARPWLYALATHQAVDALRALGRHPTVSLDRAIACSPGSPSLAERLVGAHVDPLVRLEDSEGRRWLHEEGLGHLPEALRGPLTLAFEEGLSGSEIAESLGLPLSTVKSRIQNAVVRLREMAHRAHLTG